MSKGKSWFLISYAPLTPVDTQLYESRETIEKMMPKLETSFSGEVGKAYACAWARTKDSGVMPVFVLDRAKEIYDHLVAWSEGRPEVWFKLYFYKTKKRYAIILFPEIEKSIARFKFRMALGNVDYNEKDDKIEVICHPLLFTSANLGMINKVPLAPKMSLGLLDKNDYNPKGDPMVINDPHELGPFTVGDPGLLTQYFDDLLKPA
jgi:hypothetical protein